MRQFDVFITNLGVSRSVISGGSSEIKLQQNDIKSLKIDQFHNSRTDCEILNIFSDMLLADRSASVRKVKQELAGLEC